MLRWSTLGTLEGLQCVPPVAGAKNPLAARLSERLPFSVDVDRHVLLRTSGDPITAVPAAHVGTLTERRFLVAHFSAGPKRGVERFIQTEGLGSSVSAHLIIGRDGSVSQLVPFDVGTFHAGRAARDGLSINRSSIGIELENWGTTHQKWRVLGAPGRAYAPRRRSLSDGQGRMAPIPRRATPRVLQRSLCLAPRLSHTGGSDRP